MSTESTCISSPSTSGTDVEILEELMPTNCNDNENKKRKKVRTARRLPSKKVKKSVGKSAVSAKKIQESENDLSDDVNVCCNVCERCNHAALFNIFKCFCLAQRLFSVAKLFHFNICHLKSSYICEECVERLEVIEELELLKKEFVFNFAGRCNIEEMPPLTIAETESITTTTTKKSKGKKASNNLDVTHVHEEQNSIICTSKRTLEPEVMFLNRLKRKMVLLPKNDRSNDKKDDAQPKSRSKSKDDESSTSRFDVLGMRNGLGGIKHMNLSALPTIRKLFTSNGQRRYWLLPPTSADESPVQCKKQRFSELVDYLKLQTASNALLASAKNNKKHMKKLGKKNRKTLKIATESVKTIGADEFMCMKDTSPSLVNVDIDSRIASVTFEEPDDEIMIIDQSPDVNYLATATTSGTIPTTSGTIPTTSGTVPISATLPISLAASDVSSATTPSSAPMIITERHSDDFPFNLEEKTMIETVVETFLHIDPAESHQMGNNKSIANSLEPLFGFQQPGPVSVSSLSSQEDKLLPKPKSKLLFPLSPESGQKSINKKSSFVPVRRQITKAGLQTRKIAPTIRPKARKSASASLKPQSSSTADEDASSMPTASKLPKNLTPNIRTLRAQTKLSHPDIVSSRATVKGEIIRPTRRPWLNLAP